MTFPTIGVFSGENLKQPSSFPKTKTNTVGINAHGVINVSNRFALNSGNVWSGGDSNYGFFYNIMDDTHGSGETPAPTYKYCNGPLLNAGTKIETVKMSGYTNVNNPLDVEIFLGLLYQDDWDSGSRNNPNIEVVFQDYFLNSTTELPASGNISDSHLREFNCNHTLEKTGSLFLAVRSFEDLAATRYMYGSTTITCV